MRLIVIGCEYTGKTTLAWGVRKWITDVTGDPGIGVHDHFLPHVGEGPNAVEEEAQIFDLKPFVMEKYQRYMIQYHLGRFFYLDNDHILVNWYYGDAVYAPLYFGYGGIGEYADRRQEARHYDGEVMAMAPDTALVLMKASADVVRQRLREQPCPGCRLKEADVELVLDRFAEEFANSMIRRRFALDTTDASVAETFQEFLRQIEPHLTPTDRLRILTHQALRQASSTPV